MYLMYTDESGDTGMEKSPTQYFILTGIVVHELRWRQTLDNLVKFRQHLRDLKGLKLREEIHSVNFINKPGELIRIKRNDRLDIMKQCLDWLNSQQDLGIITIAINKTKRQNDVFEAAWKALITRFDNTIRYRNFPGPSNPEDKGLVLPDNTNGKMLTAILRKMRHYNPIPNRKDLYLGGYRNETIKSIIEDPFMKDSATSFLHQMADVVAYSARQLYEPNAYMKKKGGINFYSRLNQVIVRQASPRHSLGIVEL